MVMALTVMPLLRLAGFYRAPIKMRMEQEIDRINVEDDDISITDCRIVWVIYLWQFKS